VDVIYYFWFKFWALPFIGPLKLNCIADNYQPFLKTLETLPVKARQSRTNAMETSKYSL
jgi:hypothetical protein